MVCLDCDAHVRWKEVSALQAAYHVCHLPYHRVSVIDTSEVILENLLTARRRSDIREWEGAKELPIRDQER